MLFDYELTNRDLLPALKPVFEQFRAAGGNPKLLEPVFGVQADYLQAGLDEMKQKFGSSATSQTASASTRTASSVCATRS